jgi:hypothetical protein
VVYDENGVAKFYRDKRYNLKTGMYYLRGKSSADAVKFTVAQDTMSQPTKTDEEKLAEISCSLDDPDSCVACSA